jgi:hypothetical protein
MGYDPKEVEAALRRSLRARANSVLAPDLWPGVRARMRSRRKLRIRLHMPAFRWLAPAGSVVLAVSALAAFMMFINRPDEMATDGASETAARSPGDAALPAAADPAEAFFGALDALASAGPFHAEASVTTNSPGGGKSINWGMSIALDPNFWNAYELTGAGNLQVGSGFEERNCRVVAVSRTCDWVEIATGAKAGTTYSFGGTYRSSGDYALPSRYRTAKVFSVDPETKSALYFAGGGFVNWSRYEREFQFLQFDGRSALDDGLSQSLGGQPVLVEKEAKGSLGDFLMTNIGYMPVRHEWERKDTLETADWTDMANVRPFFSHVERVTPDGETGADGLVQYRAATTRFIHSDGVWDMWISAEDGLPRRIEFESFGQTRGSEPVLIVTKGEIAFSRFGETIEFDTPLPAPAAP